MSDFLKKLFSDPAEGSVPMNQVPKEPFSDQLDDNIRQLEELFLVPKNDALKSRAMKIPSVNRRATVLFVAGAADTDMINDHVIRPLLASRLDGEGQLVGEIKDNILTVSGSEVIADFREAVRRLINGSAIILIDGEKSAIAADTAGFEKRSVGEPTREIVVKGPNHAFVEAVDVNKSLIRRQLKDHRLVSETVTVGNESPQDVSVLYLDNIADKELVRNVKDRLAKVDKDAILTLAALEELIEERPYSLFPSTVTTERPDRASSFLLEGHVVLLMDNSPDALIAPITFWSLFHTAEDHFLRWAYGNFARIMRLIALFIALLVPALYLAVITFHPEMIPTDLLLAIAGTRERVPFPSFLELLLLEITFEILREAGLRVPTPLGPTMGIVGALILGQAAVEANLVSPLLVVVIAITGLSSFALPDLGLSVMVRLLRFGFLFAAHLLGFVGIALGFAALLAYAVSIKSFGVPFFSPLTPHMPSSRDLFLRPILKKQWQRPESLSPQEDKRVEQRGGDGS
ncbi:spore germination protein [Bhargavaea ginsengi]|uniref:spore germination protein n=1 Tax=Bhargavaea ginsengi TaxID=426757 RepID=UPI00203FFACD|nr:spore germination protein [Bhargavaea ginsengi]MCM3086742.1 spore germination protein [Bhargavaea ginsengi]